MTLYPHQQKILDRNPAKHLLAHGTGTGKTVTSLALAERNCRSCLVITPKALVDQWNRAIGNIPDKKCLYYVISKETFKKDAKLLSPFEGVIVDEGHYFAGATSQLSKALFWYLNHHKIPYVWIATATPYLSTPMNIYTLARHLGHNWSYPSFKHEFFDEVRMGHRFIPKIKKGIEPKLRALVLEIGSTVDLEDVVEVPEQSFTTEFFSLTPKQIEGIKALEDTEFITRWTHTHCIENGFLYSDGYSKDQIFPSNKMLRIYELCQTHDKIAIICRYTHQLTVLKKLLSDLNRFIFVIDGSSSGRDRDFIVQQAEASSKAIILMQADCAVGYELPSVSTIVFASLSFSYVSYAQSVGRFLRINKLKKNHYIHLIVKGGVDEDVFNCIMRKEDFSFSIYGK